LINKPIHLFIFIFFNFLTCQKTYDDIQLEIRDNNKKLVNLETSIKKLEDDIDAMKNSKFDLSKSVDMLDQKIEYREKQIRILKQQDKNISELIYNSNQSIKNKNEELTILKNKLKKRLVHIFKYGKKNTISKFIVNEKWSHNLTKLKYLEVLIDYEKKLNSKIVSKIKELELEKEKLKNDKKNQKNILSEAQNIKEKLNKDKKNKVNKIKKIDNDSNKLKKNLDDKKEEISDIENVIKKLITDGNEAKKREEELAKQRAKQNKSTSGNFAKMKGRLNWPVEGKIITKFGKNINSKLNTVTENIGINIEPENNNSVYSVLDGEISIVSFLRGYGNYIVIRHGEGYFTVYANLKNISVQQGEYVNSNFKLAEVDESNDFNISKNNYMHFEIWKDETKLNPEIWLKKK
tara:strand:- start:898 stop:2115 length:1218 start_codon:yes stop_codon:yes gene_type:complete